MAEGDLVWSRIKEEAGLFAEKERLLSSYLYETILNHETLECAISFMLASKLQSPTMGCMIIREIIETALVDDPSIGASIRHDIKAIFDRDPASTSYSAPFLYFKGFHALESYRVAHWLWKSNRKLLALNLQNRISEVFQLDIHPAAQIGSGIFMDHATSIVVGETAVIEDNVSILHEVTLGGTGKESGDRHPKVRSGVLIGAGAKILGNIEIGRGAKIGAGSVVLKDVAPHQTVAGVPAKVVGQAQVDCPALEMDHRIHRKQRNKSDVWYYMI